MGARHPRHTAAPEPLQPPVVRSGADPVCLLRHDDVALRLHPPSSPSRIFPIGHARPRRLHVRPVVASQHRAVLQNVQLFPFPDVGDAWGTGLTARLHRLCRRPRGRARRGVRRSRGTAERPRGRRRGGGGRPAPSESRSGRAPGPGRRALQVDAADQPVPQRHLLRHLPDIQLHREVRTLRPQIPGQRLQHPVLRAGLQGPQGVRDCLRGDLRHVSAVPVPRAVAAAPARRRGGGAAQGPAPRR